jgi:plastocyanin
MAINQLYLIKSGENSFVEETGTIISISGGQVGIGTSAPESYLHITGSTQIDGDLTVKGNFSTVNETTVQIDDKNIELGVGSNSDMLSNGGGITLKGFTDKTITWLNYNDAWNFNTNIYVDGSGNFASGVNIEGEAVFNSDLNVSGNGNFASGVNIEGEAVFNSDLNVSGNGNFASGVNIEGEAVFNSDLNVSGNGNFASGVNIEGEAVFNSDLNVSGNGNFASGVNIEGEAVFNSDLNVSGNGNFASGVNIEGEAVFNSDLNVSGNGNFASGVNIEGEAVFNSDLNVSGNGNFASGVNIEGEAVFNSDLNVSGNGNFASGLFFKNQPVLTGIESDLSKWKINDTPSSDTYNVNISGDGQDYLFSEDFEGLDPEIKIKSGGTLVFSNIGQGHALAVKNNENVDVSVESNNQTIFAPTQTGIYTYYCQSHPEVMKGQIHVLNNQEIFYNDGDVGIGTDSPAYSLDVVGKGNFSEGLYVNGNSVLTGSTSVLGKWEDGAEAGEIFYKAGNVGIGTDNPSYNLEVKGSGNFSEGLYVNGNSVLTGSTSDLGKWGDGAEAGEIFYKAGNVGIGTDNPSVNLDVVGKTQVSESFSVSNIFSIDDQGRVGGQTPFSNDVIQWDGLKWVAAQSAEGGSNGGGEVPSALLYNLSSGESIQQVSFGQTFNVIPRIATNLEINGEGSIIPYIISGLSTSGYNAVFAKKIPNNNYRIHTVFGGKDVYWETGVSNSLVYNDGDVNLLRNLSVSGSLTVQGSPVLTGSVSDLGKWEDSVTAGEIYYNGGNVGIGTIDPAYSLHVNGTIYNQNGGINVANKFNVSTLGAVGGQSPDFNEVIKWDGTKWIAGSAPGGGATSSSEAPSAFDTWLNQGSAIQVISFVDAPEGGYQSIPSISTDVEIIEGDIIPYAISGVSTTGYYAVFSDPIPTANNYKIHTTFGGKEVYWQTGAGGNSIYYDGDDVSVDNLTIGGNLTVNGTQTIVNTETVEIEDHNLVIAANTGHNQLTAEYPGAGGAYAGILWGTGDAGAASPVSLTYQSNKGFAFEGGNVGIGTSSPEGRLHVKASSSGATDVADGTLIVEQGSNPSIQILSAENRIQSIKFGDPQAGDVGRITYSHLDDKMSFVSNGTSNMTIDSAGNVGIGTTES